jgi:hypothetical protein
MYLHACLGASQPPCTGGLYGQGVPSGAEEYGLQTEIVPDSAGFAHNDSEAAYEASALDLDSVSKHCNGSASLLGAGATDGRPEDSCAGRGLPGRCAWRTRYCGCPFNLLSVLSTCAELQRCCCLRQTRPCHAMPAGTHWDNIEALCRRCNPCPRTGSGCDCAD